MKIAICQLNFKVGDVEGNSEKILNSYRRAENERVDLAIFSELSICGYPPQDLLEYPHFIEKCWTAIQNLAMKTGNTAMIVGCPLRVENKLGKKLTNAALVLQFGKIQDSFSKTLLPTYDIFDEYRYFEANSEFKLLQFGELNFAITICEDLWDLEAPFLYKDSPMKNLKPLNPDLIINIAGSPFSYNHIENRRELMRQNAIKYNVPLVYVNQVGANTDIVFDGGSMFINSDGVIAEELDYFKEDYKTIEWDLASSYTNHSHNYKNDDIELIYEALNLGLTDYFKKSGFKSAIFGLSGGLDSAIVAALCTNALGSENVHPILLPSKYSSVHSISDAEQLCINLGLNPFTIPIQNTVTSFESELQTVFADTESGLAEENLQARVRGNILMAMSNKFGHILINTTNKSEAAVGYGTLYGDLSGSISLLGDVYKTQLYDLAKYINKDREIIPQNILDKPPSAELRFDQKDSDSLPEYEILDSILFQYIEEKKGPAEIIENGHDLSTVNKIIGLVDRNEFKRFQMAPIIRVSDKAFGRGRRMPLVGTINKF